MCVSLVSRTFLPGQDEIIRAANSAFSRVLVERSFTMVGAEWLRVTISLGATIARKDETLASLIHRADQLLYQSKQDGRNRLTLA